MIFFIVLFFCIASALHGQSSIPDPQMPYDTQAQARYFAKRTFGPQRLLLLGLETTLDQVRGDPAEWGRSGESYAYRFLSHEGKRLVRNSAQFGLEYVLGQDTRYRSSRECKFWKRVSYAVSRSVLAYKPDGTSTFAYGQLGAAIAVSTVPHTWHPGALTGKSMIGNVLGGAADQAGNNLLTEFTPDLKKFGKDIRKKIFKK